LGQGSGQEERQKEGREEKGREEEGREEESRRLFSLDISPQLIF